VRQAANLWAVKAQLHQELLGQVDFDPQISLVDSVAVPICRFARADRCRRLRELAAWGHDEVAKQTYLGLRAHLRVCWPGVIVDGRLTPANMSDLAVGEELLAEVAGWSLADRNYGSPGWPSSYRPKEGGCWRLLVGAAALSSGHRPGSPANVAGSRRSSAS
jgi:hypothetical protein